MTDHTSQTVAKSLLEIKAVALSPKEPFTWASGLKSPIYCDNRITMSYPAVRKLIAAGLANLISTHYPDVEVIAGTATAGIPHAAWVAQILDLPMVYIRSKAKDHGRGNQIEGQFKSGAKMVVIEDLISTGGSVLEAVKAAENEGAQVEGVVAIFSYQLEQGIKNFQAAAVGLNTLTDFPTLIEVAQETGAISDEELTLLKKWQTNPKNWQA